VPGAGVAGVAVEAGGWAALFSSALSLAAASSLWQDEKRAIALSVAAESMALDFMFVDVGEVAKILDFA
jgi:hypothetical protein